MLERVLRRLGYVPTSAPSLMPHSAALPANQALHQLHAGGFARATASVDALCSWHEDGDGLHYAIGRDDWVPLAVAGLCLTDNEECRVWLDETLRARVWITHDLLASWHGANRSVLHAFGVRIDERRPQQRPLWDTSGRQTA